MKKIIILFKKLNPSIFVIQSTFDNIPNEGLSIFQKGFLNHHNLFYI